MTDHPIDGLRDHLAAYRVAQGNVKAWQDTADRLKQHIVDALDAAGADIGLVSGKPAVRWTRVESLRLNTKKLRDDHPDLAAQYSVPSVTHRFTLVD
jgi:predicted phage-related endonuclease